MSQISPTQILSTCVPLSCRGRHMMWSTQFFGICLNYWSFMDRGGLISSRLDPRKMSVELIKILPDRQKVVQH